MPLSSSPAWVGGRWQGQAELRACCRLLVQQDCSAAVPAQGTTRVGSRLVPELRAAGRPDGNRLAAPARLALSLTAGPSLLRQHSPLVAHQDAAIHRGDRARRTRGAAARVSQLRLVLAAVCRPGKIAWVFDRWQNGLLARSQDQLTLPEPHRRRNASRSTCLRARQGSVTKRRGLGLALRTGPMVPTLLPLCCGCRNRLSMPNCSLVPCLPWRPWTVGLGQGEGALA